MPYLQTWIIDGSLVAQAPCALERNRFEVRQPPQSKVFFCNQCGTIYAQRIITPNTYWHVHNHPCGKHQSGSRYMEPGGSIWISWEPDYLAQLPPEVLRYETLLRLELDKCQNLQ